MWREKKGLRAVFSESWLRLGLLTSFLFLLPCFLSLLPASLIICNVLKWCACGFNYSRPLCVFQAVCLLFHMPLKCILISPFWCVRLIFNFVLFSTSVLCALLSPFVLRISFGQYCRLRRCKGVNLNVCPFMCAKWRITEATAAPLNKLLNAGLLDLASL